MIGRQRFGVGHVQRRPEPARRGLGGHGLGIQHRAAPHVHDQGAVGQQGQPAGIEQPAGLVSQRRDQDDDVGPGQQQVQVSSGVHVLGGPRLARHLDHLGLAGAQPPVQRCADRAVPGDQHAAAGQRPGVRVLPAARVLGPHPPGQFPLRGQDQRQGVLGGAGVVQAPRVAQRRARRELSQQVLVPGGERLHGPGGLDPAQRLGPERPVVGHGEKEHVREIVGPGLVAAEHLDAQAGVGQGLLIELVPDLFPWHQYPAVHRAAAPSWSPPSYGHPFRRPGGPATGNQEDGHRANNEEKGRRCPGYASGAGR